MQWRIVLSGCALCSAGKIHPIYSVMNDPGAMERVPALVERMFQGNYWEEADCKMPIKSVNLVLSMRPLERQLTYLLDFGPTSTTASPQTAKPKSAGPLFSGCSPKGKGSKAKLAKAARSPSERKGVSGE